MGYDDYKHITAESIGEGVTLLTINRPEKYNAAHEPLHIELGSIWREIDRDPATKVAVITGAGKAFCAGGDLDMVGRQTKDYRRITETLREAGDIVYNMAACEKPIISAINGVAVGAGLAVALMADISVIAEEARLTDGHLRLGVVAGDHAAIIWPLLCGMAKAKYYLLTSEFVDGREAERIGLVSMSRPMEEVLPTACRIAEGLARGPQDAIRLTKRSLNGWLKLATPIFESSLAMEMLTFFGDDVVEGRAAILEKRTPKFGS